MSGRFLAPPVGVRRLAIVLGTLAGVLVGLIVWSETFSPVQRRYWANKYLDQQRLLYPDAKLVRDEDGLVLVNEPTGPWTKYGKSPESQVIQSFNAVADTPPKPYEYVIVGLQTIAGFLGAFAATGIVVYPCAWAVAGFRRA